MMRVCPIAQIVSSLGSSTTSVDVVGLGVGIGVGAGVGSDVGAGIGMLVGRAVGAAVGSGTGVGAGDGCGVDPTRKVPENPSTPFDDAASVFALSSFFGIICERVIIVNHF